MYNSVSNNDFKNNIFDQYVAIGRYNRDACDYSNINLNNRNINFDFSNLTFDFPLFVSGDVLFDNNNNNIELLRNGQNVGGTTLFNGSYNIPILVRFCE